MRLSSKEASVNGPRLILMEGLRFLLTLEVVMAFRIFEGGAAVFGAIVIALVNRAVELAIQGSRRMLNMVAILVGSSVALAICIVIEMYIVGKVGVSTGTQELANLQDGWSLLKYASVFVCFIVACRLTVTIGAVLLGAVMFKETPRLDVGVPRCQTCALFQALGIGRSQDSNQYWGLGGCQNEKEK